MSDGGTSTNSGNTCSYTSRVDDGYFWYYISEDDSEFTITIKIRSPDSQRAKDCEEGQTKEDEEDKED